MFQRYAISFLIGLLLQVAPSIVFNEGMLYKLGSAGAGASWRALCAHGSRSLKIRGCKYPKDLRVRAPAAPVLTHSLLCV